MIVDTSAVIAVLKEEPEAGRFLGVLTASGGPKRMSAASYLEAAIVVDANRNPLLSRHKPESRSSRSTASKPRSPARPIATSEKAAAIPLA